MPATMLIIGTLTWFAGMPDLILILFCCVAACACAFPLARALGLVRIFAQPGRAEHHRLTALADFLAGFGAVRHGERGSAPSTCNLSGAFLPLATVAADLLLRRLPPAETRAALSVEADDWLEGRQQLRSLPTWICRAGPGIGFGAALAALLLMVESWTSPGTISSGAALAIGLSVVVVVGATTLLAWCGQLLQAAEISDQMAVNLVLAACEKVATGAPDAEVRSTLTSLLGPRTDAPPAAPLRKAA